ncbi:hypothetical protein RND71_009490 [Anisodus tanguticus]|uniref:Pectinesterase catalytic domain-containing protein n=1 Tax=Anisodus tanguticus TaxID=243964 RepID=A0AAE1VRV6_9SOLA|nr:hypothetical protein RND71_009490 [Anisodus tanguticus]
MAANAAAPNNIVAYYYIKIKQGTYNEYVQIEKTNIVFIGEGMGKTIISENRSYGAGIKTAYTATVESSGLSATAKEQSSSGLSATAKEQSSGLSANSPAAQLVYIWYI